MACKRTRVTAHHEIGFVEHDNIRVRHLQLRLRGLRLGQLRAEVRCVHERDDGV
jgi:hypothetical protein